METCHGGLRRRWALKSRVSLLTWVIYTQDFFLKDMDSYAQSSVFGFTHYHMAPDVTPCGLEFNLWVHKTIMTLSTAVPMNNAVCVLEIMRGQLTSSVGEHTL